MELNFQLTRSGAEAYSLVFKQKHAFSILQHVHKEILAIDKMPHDPVITKITKNIRTASRTTSVQCALLNLSSICSSQSIKPWIDRRCFGIGNWGRRTMSSSLHKQKIVIPNYIFEKLQPHLHSHEGKCRGRKKC